MRRHDLVTDEIAVLLLIVRSHYLLGVEENAVDVLHTIQIVPIKQGPLSISASDVVARPVNEGDHRRELSIDAKVVVRSVDIMLSKLA